MRAPSSRATTAETRTMSLVRTSSRNSFPLRRPAGINFSTRPILSSLPSSPTIKLQNLPMNPPRLFAGNSEPRYLAAIPASAVTTKPCDRMPHSAKNHRRPRSSCLDSPRDRLRAVDRHRRPRWRKRQLSTNIPPGPFNEGWSISVLHHAHRSLRCRSANKTAGSVLNLVSTARRGKFGKIGAGG